MLLVTEWVVKYSAYLLRALYDTYRIWYVPPLAREYISSIYFSFVLGSVVSHSELLDLIYVFYDVDWSKVPVCNARRGTSFNDASPNITTNSGDVVW